MSDKLSNNALFSSAKNVLADSSMANQDINFLQISGTQRIDAKIKDSSGAVVTNTLAYQAGPTFTSGSVIFANGSNQLTEDNSNFFFDDSTDVLRVGSTTNAVEMGPTGIDLKGTAKSVRTAIWTAAELQEGASPPATVKLNNFRFALEFDDGKDIMFSYKMPDIYENGTDLTLRIYWSPKDASAGNVDWQIGYEFVGSGDNFAGTPTTTTVTTASPGVINRFTESVMTINGTGLTNSKEIGLQLSRLGTSTYGDKSRVFTIELEYTVNEL